MQNLKKNWCCFKNDKNLLKFDPSICLCDSSTHLFLLCKVFNVSFKKVHGSCLSWHWRVMQNWKKNWLVWKMTWEIWQIFTRTFESFKIGTLMGSKFTEKLCVMTMKNNAKFEAELTCHFKTGMRNLANFDLSRALENLKKLLFNWLLWPKYIMFELRKVQRSYIWWHWRLIQNLKEKWLVLSKMTWGIWQICIGWNKWMGNSRNIFTHV